MLCFYQEPLAKQTGEIIKPLPKEIGVVLESRKRNCVFGNLTTQGVVQVMLGNPALLQRAKASGFRARGFRHMEKSEHEWKTCLTPEQYRILREKGTEMAGSGKLLHEKRKGVFVCSACGNELFSSDAKFESGTGWPSFYDVARSDAVELKEDDSHGMHRIEAVCRKCGGHLGHVFDDGPKPTGKRYCINSAALEFKEKK